MKSIALKDGDIYLDDMGNLALIIDGPECMQSCETAMKALRGEMMYDMESGIPYRAVAWDQYNPALFEAFARRTLLKVDGVTGVSSFLQSMNDGVLSYQATIQTIYGSFTVES